MSADSLYRFWTVVAAIVGTVAAIALARRRVPEAESSRLLIAICLSATVMLMGARAYGLIEVWFDPLHSVTPSSGGQRQPGAIIAVLVAFPLLVKQMLPGQSVFRLMDAMAPAVPAALVFVRIGCLLAGCCYGTVALVPWAIQYAPGTPAYIDHVHHGLLVEGAAESLGVHPLPVYFGLLAGLTAMLMWWYFPRRRFDGEVVLLGLLVQESGKFFLEFVRELHDGTSRPTSLQLTSLVLALGSATVLVTVSATRAVSAIRRVGHADHAGPM
jgi:prolipoprotein diacylglyceryltransferase